MRRSREAAPTDGAESDDSTDSTLDDGGDAVLGAVGLSLGDLGATPAEDTPDASYRAATHSFVSTDDDEVMVAGDSDDAGDARAELRAIVDGLINDQLGDTPTAPVAAGPGTPRTAASPHALTPDGKLVSIQQLVAQCNHLRVGEKPSKDRLTRVKQLNTSQRAIVQVRGANARR